MALVEIDVEGIKKNLYVDTHLWNRIQSKILPKIQRKDNDWVWIVDGCLKGTTSIQTSKGDITLKDLFKTKELFVKSYDFTRDKTCFKEAIIILSGKKQLYEVITKDNRKIYSTLDHTFFVKRHNEVIELPLKEIKVGDELICEK